MFCTRPEFLHLMAIYVLKQLILYSYRKLKQSQKNQQPHQGPVHRSNNAIKSRTLRSRLPKIHKYNAPLQTYRNCYRFLHILRCQACNKLSGAIYRYIENKFNHFYYTLFYYAHYFIIPYKNQRKCIDRLAPPGRIDPKAINCTKEKKKGNKKQYAMQSSQANQPKFSRLPIVKL